MLRDNLLSLVVRRDTVSTGWPWYVQAVRVACSTVKDVRLRFTVVKRMQYPHCGSIPSMTAALLPAVPFGAYVRLVPTYVVGISI